MTDIQAVALVIACLAASFPALVLLKMYLVKQFKKKGIVTVANVINEERRTGSKGAVYYIWTVQYRDENARLYRGSMIGYRANAIGATVPIIYKASDPKIFRTEFGKNLPKVLTVSIVFFVVVVVFCLWLLQQQR